MCCFRKVDLGLLKRSMLLALSVLFVAGVAEAQEARVISFAGINWLVKSSAGTAGPGPNYFSDDPKNVWVDDQDRVHLKITHQDDKWYCAELITQEPTGYGTYVYELTTKVDKLDQNIVFGLFTWDNHTWKTDANSEIDIEFARWAEADAPNLHYSVHPSRGPDDPSGRHRERYTSTHMKQNTDVSTHVAKWTPTQIDCASYQGSGYPTPAVLLEWSFDDKNPARITVDADGNRTEKILIPKPSPTTTAHINLWLLDADGDRLGDPPLDGQEVEVIVSKFEYQPLEPNGADEKQP